MKKLLTIILPLCLVMAACAPIEEQARNAAAALSGSLVQAQAHYQASCSANPSQEICQTINKAVKSQNALITSIQAYCGWSAAVPPADVKAKCVPVTTAEAGLRTAIANADQITKEVKEVLK